MAIASLVLESQGPKLIQLAAQFLNHGFQLRVLLAQPRALFLNRLHLLALARTTLRSRDLVLLAVALFALRRACIGFSGSFILRAVLPGFLGFAVPLVGGIAGAAGFVAFGGGSGGGGRRARSACLAGGWVTLGGWGG
jgi:hypothetical protein